MVALGVAAWLIVFATTKNAQYYISNAQKLLANGDVPGAVIELRNAARLNAGNGRIHLQLSDLYLKLYDAPAAEAEARLARGDGATDDQVAPLLARAMLLGGKFAELLRQIRPGERPAKVESQVRLVLGSAYLALHEIGDAERFLKDAERLDDEAVGPKIGIVGFLLSQDDIAGAEAELARARAIAPDDTVVMHIEAEVRERTGDHSGARAGLDAILAKNPNDVDALVLRAAIRIDANDLAAAGEDVAHALGLNSDLLVGRYLDAILSFRRGELADADEKLTAISDFLGTTPEALYLQGVVKAKLGRYPAAVGSLSKYMAARPKDPRGARLLASLALRQGDAARAIEIVRPMLAADPADQVAAVTMARAYLAKGDRDTALTYYDRAATAMLTRPKAVTQSAPLVPIQGNDWLAKEIDALAPVDTNGEVEAPVRLLADLRAGAMTRAAAQAEALVRRDRNDLLALDWLGIIRMRQKNYSDAERIFTDLVGRDVGFIDPQRNLARLYVEMHRPEEARKAWETVLARDTVDLAAFLGLAQIAVQAKDDAKALEWLRFALRSSPNDPSPGKELVKLYASQSDWANADKAGRELLVLFPTDPDVVELVAQARADSGDLAGAISLFQQRIALLPKPTALLEREGKFLARIGDREGARNSFMKALALAPTNVQDLESLVDLDYATKGLDQALETARAFAQVQPVISDMLVAKVYVNAKQPSDAIAALTTAHELHPAAPLAILLAELLAQSGQPQAGGAILESWLEQHPDDWKARLALGNLYAAEHKDDAAQAAYKAVVAQVPTNVIALNNLAWIAAKTSDPDAREWAERAYYLAPTAHSADTLGWILANSGMPLAGLRFLQEASTRLPDNKSMQYHLAFALDATGQPREARDALERVLKSNSPFDGDQEARRLLERLQSN